MEIFINLAEISGLLCSFGSYAFILPVAPLPVHIVCKNGV
jgi:hypothetical protein